MNLTTALIDFAQISLLLFIGAFLRKKVPVLQKYYMPAALIGGVLGMILGPQVCGKYLPISLNYSPLIKQWPGILSCIIFSCSFMGLKLDKVNKSAIQTYFLAGSIHQMQIVVGLTLTFIVGLFVKDLPFGFGILPVLGFYGGHGMAIAGGDILAEAGYLPAGPDIGATFGTIGMLCGIIWGMIIINKAADKGITAIKMKREDMPESMMTGYIPPEERKSIGRGVSSPAALDPLASQLLLVGLMVLFGYVIRNGLIMIHPFFKNLPLFACCLIFSAIFGICTQNNKTVNALIERPVIVRISSCTLEYMITAALATTRLSVFADYGIALVVVSVGVAIGTYYFCFGLAKKILLKDGQFETGLGLFGQCCGVLATGLLLLKVVDPDFKTTAAANITSSSTLGYTYQLQYTIIFIALIMTKPLFVYIYSWILLFLLMGCGLYFGKKLHAKGL